MLWSALQIANAKLSVPINNVFVAFKELPKALARFCAPAYFHIEDAQVDIAVRGSTFRLRYRGRNLVLFTKHQLGKGTSLVRPEQFALVYEREGRLVGAGPSGVSTLKMQDPVHANLEDIVILEYEALGHDQDPRGFFVDLDLGKLDETLPPGQLKAFFAFGFSGVFGEFNFECDEDGVLTTYGTVSRRVKLYLAPDGPAVMDTENRRAFIQDPRADQEIFEPEGMSGAPVFFLWLDQSYNAHLGFAGLITNARPDRFMVYDASALKQVLDRYVDGV